MIHSVRSSFNLLKCHWGRRRSDLIRWDFDQIQVFPIKNCVRSCLFGNIFVAFWPIFDDIEGQRVLGRRIKPSPQPICLGLPQPPFSVLSGNSKPIFPDYGSNFVNKVEEACNPLSARVEGLLSQFSNLPNLLQANPTVVGKGEGCKYFLFEKNYANDKEMCFSLQGTYLRQPLGAVRQYLRAHDAGVLSFPQLHRSPTTFSPPPPT